MKIHLAFTICLALGACSDLRDPAASPEQGADVQGQQTGAVDSTSGVSTDAMTTQDALAPVQGGTSAHDAGAAKPGAQPVERADAAIDAGKGSLPSAEDAATSCVPGRVWTGQSRQIELKHFGGPSPSVGFRGQRTDLTPQQLAALDGLCVIPKPSAVMGSDGDLYRVDVTAASGSVASYVAFGSNVLLKGSWETDPTPMLDFASLMPFLSTVSKCLSVGTPVQRDAGTSTGCI